MKPTWEEAHAFLHREAQLLDEGRLDEWLELFTEDGMYWVPIDEKADPEWESSVLYDDHQRRAERVHQLLHEPRYAQQPASRTIHFISNVQVDGGDGDPMVRCNVIVYELRPGDWRQAGLGEQRSLAARCEYRLRSEDGWRIAAKKVVLLNRDMPLENLTFIM